MECQTPAMDSRSRRFYTSDMSSNILGKTRDHTALTETTDLHFSSPCKCHTEIKRIKAQMLTTIVKKTIHLISNSPFRQVLRRNLSQQFLRPEFWDHLFAHNIFLIWLQSCRSRGSRRKSCRRSGKLWAAEFLLLRNIRSCSRPSVRVTLLLTTLVPKIRR